MNLPTDKNLKIAIIGFGNLGVHLAIHLSAHYHKVIQILSQSYKEPVFIVNERQLRLKIPVVSTPQQLTPDADVYLLAVRDDYIGQIAAQLHLPGKIVAHCSASADLNLLKSCSENTGVFYPLQTFSKEVPARFENIPILIEASNQHTLQVLKNMASLVSSQVIEVNGKQRLAIHVAAVFANNFTNHLIAAADQILSNENISYKILLPLIHETVNRLHDHHPSEIQSGPARRNDSGTIDRHLNYLQNNSRLRDIYKFLSEKIKDENNK